LKEREIAQELDRKRHLLITRLQHLKKKINVLVIGPKNSGKTSLINSLAYMIRKDGNSTNPEWRDIAKYGTGKQYRYTPNTVWRHKTNSVSMYETAGFENIYDSEKASTILQYVLEGRLPQPSAVLQLYLFLNAEVITEKYREDPTDPRVLEDRRIDAIICCSPNDQPPNQAIFNVVSQAITQSKDQRVRKIPVLSVVTAPLGDDVDARPVCNLRDYDLAHYIKTMAEGGTTMRRNKSMSILTSPSSSTPVATPTLPTTSASTLRLNHRDSREPSTVRTIRYYEPTYDPLLDECDRNSIGVDKPTDRELIKLFEDTLRVSQRVFQSRTRRIQSWIQALLH
jgi:energy-coupling factor transporter ATP-binding protein EcfA2